MKTLKTLKTLKTHWVDFYKEVDMKDLFCVWVSPDNGHTWPWHIGVCRAASIEAANAFAQANADRVVHDGQWVDVIGKALPIDRVTGN